MPRVPVRRRRPRQPDPLPGGPRSGVQAPAQLPVRSLSVTAEDAGDTAIPAVVIECDLTALLVAPQLFKDMF